jgi:hypothetical protein
VLHSDNNFRGFLYCFGALEPKRDAVSQHRNRIKSVGKSTNIAARQRVDRNEKGRSAFRRGLSKLAPNR